MKSPQQRAAKRLERERRKNKGVSTEAKRQKHNDNVRKARIRVGNLRTSDERMLLLAASMVGRK